MEVLISIIVPVFNAEKFVERCIDSINKNSLKNYEILIIDDGSTDDSFSIISKLKDDRIRIFQHANHGLGYTRNRGLSEARGKYVVCIDSDDYVDADYLQTLYDGVQNNDVAISGLRLVTDSSGDGEIRTISNDEWAKFRFPLSGGKIYRRAFIEENNFRYPEDRFAEDLPFNIMCYSKTNKIKIIDYYGYNYYQNPNGLMGTTSNQSKMLPLLQNLYLDTKGSKFLNKEYIGYFYRKTLIHGTFLRRKQDSVSSQVSELNEALAWADSIYSKKWITPSGEDKVINFYVNLVFMCYKLKILKPFIAITSKL